MGFAGDIGVLMENNGVFIVAMPAFATSNQNFTALKELVILCQNSALLFQNSVLYCACTLN
jgi:hypothetical protein